MHIVLLLIASAAAAAEPVAVLPLKGEGFPAATLHALDSVFAVSMAEHGPYRVITADDINALLGVQKMKDAMGCDEVQCAADLAGALGAPFVASGALHKLGDNVLVTLTLIDARALTSAKRTQVKISDHPELYDQAIDNAVRELFGKQSKDIKLPVSSEIRFQGTSVLPPEIDLKQPKLDMSDVNLEAEQLLEEALDAQERKDSALAAQKWCALAGVRGKNPYKSTAKTACSGWKKFAEEQRQLGTRRAEDYQKLRGYLALRRKSKEQKLAAAQAFVRAYDDETTREVSQIRAAIRTIEGSLDGDATPVCTPCDDGACVLDDFTCVVDPKDGCANAAWCKQYGACTLVDGRCQLTGCNTHGHAYQSCMSIAGSYAVGRGVKADQARARALYQLACETSPPELAHNPCAAAKCLSGQADSCDWAAMAYEKERDVADALRRRGCDGGSGLCCDKLGEGARDAESRAGYYAKACRANVAYCFHQAGRAAAAGRHDEALSLLERSCDAGNTWSCSRLGLIYAGGRPGSPFETVRIKTEPARALAAYGKGCQPKAHNEWEERPYNCWLAGTMLARGAHGSRPDFAAALRSFELACNDPAKPGVWGCREAARLLATGRGAAKDVKQARAILDRACQRAYNKRSPQCTCEDPASCPLGQDAFE